MNGLEGGGEGGGMPVCVLCECPEGLASIQLEMLSMTVIQLSRYRVEDRRLVEIGF
jgi:hypothetical protein